MPAGVCLGLAVVDDVAASVPGSRGCSAGEGIEDPLYGASRDLRQGGLTGRLAVSYVLQVEDQHHERRQSLRG